MKIRVNINKLIRIFMLPLLLLSVVIVYARGLGGSFVIDDRTYFIDNDLLPQLYPWQLREIFLNPSNYWGELLPLRDFFYILQFQFFSVNPLGYHVVSLLLYLLVIASAAKLVTAIGDMDGGDGTLFLPFGFTLAFFALHPLHVESVAYISGQKDLLCVLFSFLAITRGMKLLQPGFTPGKRDIALFLLCYYAAFLSKNLAVATAFILTLLGLLCLWRDSERRWRFVGGWLAINLPVLVWMRYSLSVVTGVWGETDILTQLSFAARLIRAVKIYGEHFFLLVWPFRLNFGYEFNRQVGLDGVFWCGAVGLLLLLFLFLRFREWTVRLGVLLIVCYLLPVSQIFHELHNAAVYDRYAFVPVLGVGLLLSRGIIRLGKNCQLWQRSVRLSLYSLLVLLLFLTARHVPVYRSDVTVTEHAYALFPEWNATSFNLAVALIEAGKIDKARELLREEMALQRPTWVPGFLSGLILLKEGLPAEAVAPLQLSFWLSARGGYFPYAAIPLARANLQIGNELPVMGLLNQVLHSLPRNPQYYFYAKKMQSEILIDNKRLNTGQ